MSCLNINIDLKLISQIHKYFMRNINKYSQNHKYRLRGDFKFMEMIELFYFAISRNFNDLLSHINHSPAKKHTRSALPLLFYAYHNTKKSPISCDFKWVFLAFFSIEKKSSRFGRSAEGGLWGVDNNDSSRRLVPNLSPMHPMSTKKKAPSP